MKKLFVVLMVLPALITLVQASDFNGDGIDDIGIYRPSSGLWAIRGVTRVYYGGDGDDPVPGNYNGDGTADIAIFRRTSGLWSIKGVSRVYFGSYMDVPVNGSGSKTWSRNIYNDLYYTGGWVGVKTDDPYSPLHVVGSIRSSSGDADAGGVIKTYGPNGNFNTRFTYLEGAPNDGAAVVSDQDGNAVVALQVNSVSGGNIMTFGPNGNPNAALMYVGGYPNNGALGVYDSSGTGRAGIQVNSSGYGIVFGDIKSMRVKNPLQEGTDIWYACPEGPEAAIYFRGSAQLNVGCATISLPDHFAALASEEDLTVQLTPCSTESMGLAVTEKSLDGIEVRECRGGEGNYYFDYLVMATRKKHKDFKVIRKHLSGAVLPQIAGEEANNKSR